LQELRLPASLSTAYNALSPGSAKETVMKRAGVAASVLSVSVLLLACAPEVGSEAWCEAMDETPTGDWTVNQAADFARHCLLKAPDRDQPQ
jgi:hypothetical protein